MQAIILAAGRGTRLKPLTSKLPKPLIKVGGLTLLERNLGALPADVEEVLIVVNYLQEQVRAHIGDNWRGKKIIYVEQKKLNGTGGALYDCRAHLAAGSFLVLNGDDLYAAEDLKKMVAQDLAMLTTPITDPTTAATCRMDKQGCLVEVIEAGREAWTPPFLANCGAYVLNQAFFTVPPVKIPNGEFGLPQTLVNLALQGHKIALLKTADWQPVGNHAQLKKARARFIK